MPYPYGFDFAIDEQWTSIELLPIRLPRTSGIALPRDVERSALMRTAFADARLTPVRTVNDLLVESQVPSSTSLAVTSSRELPSTLFCPAAVIAAAIAVL